MATQPETTPAQPDATVALTAELWGAMWTLFGTPSNGGDRQTLGSGPAGSSIAFPVKLLERMTSTPS